MTRPISLTKDYAGDDWLAKRALAQKRRDERDYFDRGTRLVWGDPIQSWHPNREDAVAYDDERDGWLCGIDEAVEDDGMAR